MLAGHRQGSSQLTYATHGGDALGWPGCLVMLSFCTAAGAFLMQQIAEHTCLNLRLPTLDGRLHNRRMHSMQLISLIETAGPWRPFEPQADLLNEFGVDIEPGWLRNDFNYAKWCTRQLWCL